MSNKGITMAIQDEIIRLKKLGRSQRKVAKLLGIHRDSVAKYWQGTITSGVPTTPDWVNELDWEYIAKEIKNNVSKKILYQELKNPFNLPAYSNFCRYLKIKFPNKNTSNDITIRIVRTPGDSVEVDYSGDTIPILNPSTGEIIQAQLFVGAMSFSSHFYAEFTLTQTTEDFISAHNRMFHFFGGVPDYIIPDNCKTAVIKADKYDPELNETYHDMCVHYNITVDPARASHPRDKPNVERAVGILQQDFFKRVRKKTYTYLRELNQDLWNYIIQKQEEIIKERGSSRIELFSKERPFLKALPATLYEIFYFKRSKVHLDCHIKHLNNFYSVPYTHVGKELRVKYNSQMVYIYSGIECVAIHSSQRGVGHFSTNDSHYPEKKIVDLHMSILSLEVEAEKIGPETSKLIKILFREQRFPLKNLRKVQGIISLSKKYENKAMEYAAKTATTFNKTYYRFIQQCADNYTPPKENNIYKAPSRQMELVCLQGGNQ